MGYEDTDPAPASTTATDPGVARVHRWGRWEGTFESNTEIADPVHEVDLRVEIIAPSGTRRTIPAFWDGGRTWRVRFCPDEIGDWSYTTRSTPDVPGLDGQAGSFVCVPYDGDNSLYRHGRVGLGASCRHLAHADGTPFFYLADTVWLGPMMSTPEEWEHYLNDRASKKFTAVQYLSTQFRSIAHNAEGRTAYSGTDHIAIDPAFFRRLDARVDAMNAHGLLAVPIVIHAGKDTTLNPGKGLPQDQVIVLARYIVARYGGNHVLWDLIAEANFHDDGAAYWREVGRAIFDAPPYPLVTLHPGGMDWALEEFNDEPWMTVMGYQSAHGDNETFLRWITEGPPSTDWRRDPARPYINLEPPYEGHLAYHSRQPFDDFAVRRASYWSLLVSPPAGVCYGAHGVWSWSDGKDAPMAHKNTGVPLPWRDALDMPGSRHMTVMADLMDSLPWWRLRPAPEMIGGQPGRSDARRTIVASRTEDGATAIVYVPLEERIDVRLAGMRRPLRGAWVDPRTGARQPIEAHDAAAETWSLRTPGPGDWVLVLEAD